MHLIVIVAALLIERTLGQLTRWRRVDAFSAYVRLIERTSLGRLWLARPAGVAVILPPLLVVGAAQWAIDTHLWLGAQLAFGLLGLLISLGPRDLWEDVYALANARTQAAHDEAEARAIALCRRATGKRAADIKAPTILGAVLVQGHERVLGVLLWFFVAGPTGALFYRLVRELPALAARDPATRATERVAAYVHGIAAWIPARIVALLYAVAGQTGAAFAAWRTARATTRLSGSASWQLLAVVGRGALGESAADTTEMPAERFNQALLDALSLISRAVLILLALFAVFTLFGILR
ncbi:regulatory signaling modulator protein AmpE [Salinisphaera hydrothermalis]|uniref:Signaling modulator of AmpD, AmpE n=1 Tax=Salinisphaera hydrothermalis (strain C41B8) TaxID=1304275 RepID=A0A084IIJ3_SALHC|nr:regulatory signaling modulator protein AmpE [Salinisphaera hydrothermalis]KEZ76527.1 signaling modulator of AmpD, AmpE [Salinisphaera hydrothermalis C41B8]